MKKKKFLRTATNVAVRILRRVIGKPSTTWMAGIHILLQNTHTQNLRYNIQDVKH